MKMMTFTMFDVDKSAEVAKAGDKIPDIPGIKVLAMYACQGIPFPPSSHTTLNGSYLYSRS